MTSERGLTCTNKFSNLFYGRGIGFQPVESKPIPLPKTPRRPTTYLAIDHAQSTVRNRPCAIDRAAIETRVGAGQA